MDLFGKELSRKENTAASTHSFQDHEMSNMEGPFYDTSVVPVQEKASTGYNAPPDGGLEAWLRVAGSFFLYFNTWGIVNTFGVFQTYYATSFLSNQSPSNISWIGAIQAFLLLLVGVITGPLYDQGYFRTLVIAGSSLVVFGLMMTSICTQYWQVLLAQGMCIGLGQGLITVPAVAILPQYFAKRKALAVGVAVSGSSLGGVIQPIVFRQLQPRIGFPWTTRVLGFIAFATCLFSISVMRVRQMPKQKRSLVDSAAFREAPFSLFCIAMFFGYVGFFGPIFYVSSYAIDTAGVDHNVAFYLLSDNERSINSRSYTPRVPCSQDGSIEHAASWGINHGHLGSLLDRHPQHRRNGCVSNPLWVLLWWLRLSTSGNDDGFDA